MINNYKEKLYIESQISKLDKILISLKDDLLPHREEQYKVMAEVYVRKIRELREEIDEYTGMEILNIKRNDINIHIEGPYIDFGSAPISIISNFLNNFRKALQNFYTTLNDIAYKNRIPKQISELTDLQLQQFSPGSINLSLSLPEKQMNFLEGTSIDSVIKTYFDIANWLITDNNRYVKGIKEEKFEKLLICMLRTFPDDKYINKITYSGNLTSSYEKIVINSATKKKAIEKIGKTNNENEITSVIGSIREIDLDKFTFVVRNIENSDRQELRCKITSEVIEDIRCYLDSKVSINGFLKDNVLDVKFIEVAEDTE